MSSAEDSLSPPDTNVSAFWVCSNSCLSSQRNMLRTKMTLSGYLYEMQISNLEIDKTDDHTA